MKVAFFTEGQWEGKVDFNHPNMRTEFAWMYKLNAFHFPLEKIKNFSSAYDVAVCIMPKKNPSVNLDYLKSKCEKLYIMQEGPNWYWQDYDLPQQIQYLNNLEKCDSILVHNEIDKKYYEGLTGKPCKILPSLMVEPELDILPLEKRRNTIIGGNFCSWYGGFDSYMIARSLGEAIYAPSMGRKREDEERIQGLNHLPYMCWKEWINILNQFKYAIHLMRTHAAGTFALNCAYLGIPCVGYKGLDTQEKCHPELSIDIADLKTAKEKILCLKNDEKFYRHCADQAKLNYNSFYKDFSFKL